MARSYQRIMKQLKALQRQATLLNKMRASAIARLNALIKKHGLTLDDIFGGSSRPRGRRPAAKRAGRRRKKVVPKYRGPGEVTWSGRGLTPVWLREAVKKGKRST